MEQKTIQEILKNHTKELMSIPGVVGTAIGKHNNKLCIMILVTKKTPELIKKIPTSLEGVSVVIEETGEIKSLEKQ